MSVFQLNDWWTVQVSSTEEFDHGSMCVGNVDNAYPAMDKIVVGSLAGMLRIYSPTKPVYRIEDLVIEEDLGAPILQLLMGKFIPSTDSLGLAVLHPRKLSVYEVVPQGNKEGRATHHTMRKAYEHNLGLDGGKHFTAFNMTSGPFGGVKGRDMILVQSLDGKLQVFEQSANAFTRQLVDCLLPGPVAYLSRMDAFVTTNYACQSECYRYQVLAASSGETSAPVVTLAKGGNENNSTAFGVSAIRNALVEWSINVGESCRQIEEGCYTRATNSSISNTAIMGSKDSSTSRNSGEVLVLCDKSIFLLKDSGGIIQQRRLEKEPCCFAKYAVGGSVPTASSSSSSSSSLTNDGTQGHNFILACRDGTLQVYSEFNLVWAAKLPASSSSSSSAPVPVQVAVAQFGDQRGLVVTLDDAGRLLVGYMGTKPPLATVPSLMPSSGSGEHSSSSSSAHREVDYDRLDEEHRALLQVIRESQSTEGKAKEQPKDRLLIRAQVPRALDLDAATGGDGGGLSTSNLPPDYLVPLSSFSGNAVASSSSGGAHRGGNNNLLGTNGYVKVCLKVYLTHSGDKPATNVSIVLSCPSFLHAEPKNIVIQRIGGASTTPVLVKFYLYATKACLPSGLDVQVVATYTSPGGEPRVSTHAVPLPLAVACRLKPASKNAMHKLTLDTPGVPALSLTEDLFDDMIAAAAEMGSLEEVAGQANAMGFQMWSNGGGGDLLTDEEVAGASSSSSATAGQSSLSTSSPSSSLVSILVSKNAGRYRVQSDSMPALFLIVDELEKRLNARLAQKGIVATASSSQGRLVTTEDAYPLNDYFAIIRAHFHTRRQLALQVSLLNDRAHQFRMVQKRLLVRFKDRNPTPLGGLDSLMKESYAALLTTSDGVQESQRRVGRLMGDLSCASKLITLLATMRCGLSPQERLVLDSFLCPQLEEGLGGEQGGWEELVDASLTYLLKTSLAKNVKDTASLPAGALELPSDLDGLLKHIQMVLDRLGKGGRLIVESPAATATAIGTATSSS